MRRAIIISGFPGIGKTTLADKRRIAEDLESTLFHWRFEERHEEDGLNTVRYLEKPEEIPGWVSGYVDHINKVSQDTDAQYVLVSSHREVREEMTMRGIPYIIVAPFSECKDEYLARYLERGSAPEFIQLLYDKWDSWLGDLENDGAPIIHLKPGQVLADLFKYIGR